MPTASPHPQYEPADPQNLQPPEEIRHVEVHQEFSGSLPHPNLVGGYESILPGSADRMFKMAEENAEHTRQMNLAELQLANRKLDLHEKAIDGQVGSKKRGQRYGLGAVLLVLCLASFLAYTGSPGYAVTLATGTLASLAAVFVIGQNKSKQSASKKEPSSPPSE